MRPVSQVEPRVGMNLLMCVPPDHMRDDLPSAVSLEDVSLKLSSFPWKNSAAKMYVRITDDMGNTVTLPCFDAVKRENKLLLMAHRTGRPVK